jgi:GNAT superfamily N-acetyltransferase
LTTIRAALSVDQDRWLRFLEERGMRYAARLGELHDPASDDAFLAEDRDGALVGLLTYRLDGADCEVSTLYVADAWRGVGTALMEAVVEAARRAGCRRLWLVTTNDNVDALRFYQRRGFRLAALHAGAVDESRATLKPSIPELGDHGIAIHDEIVLELVLRPAMDSHET